MDLLDTYFAAKKAVLEHFGIPEHWGHFPIDDHRDQYWMKTRGSVLKYSPDPFTPASIEAGTTLYSEEAEESFCRDGLVVFRTPGDEDSVLMVFDLSKECTDKELAKLCEECW